MVQAGIVDPAKVTRSALQNATSVASTLLAASASSIRSFASFISVSVAAPTRITATPPASLASLSWSFSLSKSDVVKMLRVRLLQHL